MLFCYWPNPFCRQDSILYTKVNFVYKIQFCIQNSILSDKILFCLTKFYFVWQNSILCTQCYFVIDKIHFVNKILFCIQNSILYTKFNYKSKKHIWIMDISIPSTKSICHCLFWFCWQNWFHYTEWHFTSVKTDCKEFWNRLSNLWKLNRNRLIITYNYSSLGAPKVVQDTSTRSRGWTKNRIFEYEWIMSIIRRIFWHSNNRYSFLLP